MQTTVYPNRESGLTIIQSRAEMNHKTIDEYAAEMRHGVEFDPAEAISHNGHLYVYNGAHRIEAARKAGVNLKVTYQSGTRTDAEWMALSANTKHGLQRTTKDKRRVTKNALLTRPELSNRRIADHCSVDHKTVGTLREQLETSGEIPQIAERTVTRGGKTFTQKAKQAAQAPTFPECNICKTTLNPDTILHPVDGGFVCTECQTEAQAAEELRKYTETREHAKSLEVKNRAELKATPTYASIETEKWRTEQYKHIATLICHNCNEQTIKLDNTTDAIRCDTCNSDWPCVAAFEREATTCKNIESQTIDQLHATVIEAQANSQTIDQLRAAIEAQRKPTACVECGADSGPLTSAGFCQTCAAPTPTAETIANHRANLVERLDLLARSIPDEHLDSLATWVQEIEEEFLPVYNLKIN